MQDGATENINIKQRVIQGNKLIYLKNATIVNIQESD